MNKLMLLTVLVLSCFLVGCDSSSYPTTVVIVQPEGEGGVAVDVDWDKFMSLQNPVWTEMPTRWYDAPFMGNGMIGTLVRQSGDNQVRWDVGRSDVHDHRQTDDYSVRSPEILNRGRLPIGHFVLKTKGKIKSGEMRLDLWDAEALGRVFTDAGVIEWRTFVHAEDMAFVVELKPVRGEVGCEFEFVPEKAESNRLAIRKASLPLEFVETCIDNPEPVLQKLDNVGVCEQMLAAGGKTTTAWYHKQRESKQVYVVTVQHSYPETDATERAVKVLKKVELADRKAWEAKHREWWHDYYKQSFVSFSDTVWESYYWIQMYKLACATRADRALIDNQGPWLQPTGWNGTWWNLNIQLSYSPVATANRLDIGKSLTGHLERNFRTLIDNVEQEYRHDSAGISRNTAMDLKGKVGKPGSWDVGEKDIGSEVGNLTWTCHNLYQMYRHSMDEGLRDRLLYPLLKRSINYYGHFLVKGDDGRLHLPETHSPEYGNAEDANYDIALIRWGCLTLIELADERGVNEPLVEEWERILEGIVDYPVNENGFMVGAGVGFDKSHRHWSHMLMVYPLRVVTPDEDEELIRKSLARWHSFPNALMGYSFTGGASFSAYLGDGDKALEYMNGFLPFLGASTMYFEGGSKGLPVMETPLHGAQALQEMLLQSWGGVVRVLPAVPGKWSDVSFDGLLAEGAFEVSAVRSSGVTQWVAIKSLAGQKCVVEVDIAEPMAIIDGRERQLERVGENRYELNIAKGEQAIISSRAAHVGKSVVRAVKADANVNYFGKNNRSKK